MNIAVSVATVIKKAAELLLTNKKGIKFVGYVIGIALFIILLPDIMLWGFFGWISGDGGTLIDRDMVISRLPIEQQEQIASIDTVCDTIVTVFKTYDLAIADQRKAQAIYISKLIGMESNEGFYDDLADCFLFVSQGVSVYDLISERFLVAFDDKEIKSFDEMYGVTLIRLSDENKN